MKLVNELQNLILYDRKNIFKRINVLKAKLGIDKKTNELVNFIDDIDFIILSNLDFDKNSRDIKDQLIKNADKRLELRCVINGQKKYIKGYGSIKDIPKEKLRDIFEFITLFRLSKKIKEVSYYASQHYRIDKVIEEVTT
jgi:hypothetical protein